MSDITYTNRVSDSRLEDGKIQIVGRGGVNCFELVLGRLWSDFDEKFRKMLLRPHTTPGTAKIWVFGMVTIQMHGFTWAMSFGSSKSVQTELILLIPLLIGFGAEVFYF